MDEGDGGFKFTAATFGSSHQGPGDDDDPLDGLDHTLHTQGTVSAQSGSRKAVKFPVGAHPFSTGKKHNMEMTLMESVFAALMTTDPAVQQPQNPQVKRKTSLMSMMTVTLQKAPGTIETLNRLRRLSRTFSMVPAALPNKGINTRSGTGTLEDSLSMFSIQASAFQQQQQQPHAPASQAERAIQNQVEKATINVVQMQLQKQKTEEAAIRKKFLEDIKKSHKVCMWNTVLAAVQFVIKTKKVRDATRRKEQIQGQLEPIILRWFRRLLRVVRTKMLCHRMNPPTLGAIKYDKMFSLFSDGHLMHFIDCMKPRYYFENETIVFKEISDDEAYALAEGTADVMVGKTKVFTMKAGMFFGSIGMISGEPRSATIIAREPCLVWVGCRADFESYGVKDSQVAVAHALISELRQKNMRQVYQSMLQPDNIAKFDLLKGVPLDAVSSLLADGEPRAFKPGEVLVRVTRPALHESSSYLLLRGKVQLLVTKERLADPLLTARLSEDLAWTVDFMAKSGGRAVAGSSDMILVPQKNEHEDDEGDMKGLVVVAECFAPCFVSLPFVITNEFKGIAVQCLGSTDALVLRREKVLSLDILALAQIRQSSLNIRCRFMKPLSKEILLKTIFPSTMAFDFLNNLKVGSITMTPWVFNQGDQLVFDDDHGFEMMIMTAGVVDDGSQVLPRIWPELYVAYFGCVSCIAHCTTRVEAFKFSRTALLNKLQESLRDTHLETLVGALATAFVEKRARRPNFVDSGFGGGLNGRRFTRLNLKRIASIRHAPIDMLVGGGGGGRLQRRSVVGGGLINFLQDTGGGGKAHLKRKSISFNFDMPMVSSMRRASTSPRKSTATHFSEAAMCESMASSRRGLHPKSASSKSGDGRTSDDLSAQRHQVAGKIGNMFRTLFPCEQGANVVPRPPVPPLPKEARVVVPPPQVPEKDQWLVELQQEEEAAKHPNRTRSRPTSAAIERSCSTSPRLNQPTLHPAPPRPNIYQRRAHASRMQDKQVEEEEGLRRSEDGASKPAVPYSNAAHDNLLRRPLMPPQSTSSKRPHSAQPSRDPGTLCSSPSSGVISLLRPSTATPQRFLNRMHRLEVRLANEVFGARQAQ